MIYLVDEDIVQLQALVAALEWGGKSVRQIGNADEALTELRNAIDVELVLIDVMLGTRTVGSSEFTRSETQDFLVTGLQLAEKLVKSGNSSYPARLAFLSMASSTHVVEQIRSKAKELGIPYLDKREMSSSIMTFAEKIDRLSSKI